MGQHATIQNKQARQELFEGVAGIHVRNTFEHVFNLAGWTHVGKVFGMTPRETQIGILLCQGSTAEEIAEQIGISVGTVREYVKRILRMCGVHRRERAVLKMLLVAWSLTIEKLDNDGTRLAI